MGALRTPQLVVGIGASAGGLDALERLFGAVGENQDIAYVVVQHLSPDFESMMDELLSRYTPVPVKRAENGMPVEANTIYVLPPRKEMIISSGELLLTEKSARHLRLPIDVFFRSLAQERGARGVGIVLSGTGSDGSRGVVEIHDAGGLVLVQAPATARFDGMPKSAHETGVADLVLSPEQMPETIAKYLEHIATKGAAVETSRDSSALEEVLALIRRQCDVDFTGYKDSTVTRRIERRMILDGKAAMADYLARLERDPDEVDRLYRDLLIGVTRFFRDRGAFETVRDEVLPDLIEHLDQGQELRVWCAGCATGEEAYSLAILVREAFEEAGRPVAAKIFATDVHRRSLEIASAGMYTESALGEVSRERRERWFKREGDYYKVSNALRQMIVFAPHNLVENAPFTRMDLISCRNVLIYLESATQKKVLSLFLFSLKKDGILLLGRSENTGAYFDDFEEVHHRFRIFRKSQSSRPALTQASPRPRPVGRQSLEQRYSITSLLKLYDNLLAEHMPPSFLVNDSRELVHSFGGASRFLLFSDGRPSVDLLEIMHPELKVAVTGALQRVRATGEAVSLTGVEVSSEDCLVKVSAEPIETEGGPGHVLISIERLEEAPELPERKSVDVGELSRERVRQLERELQHTREGLQATIEELETSNEELQATNEELTASNEELQSTNEELQSVNEELYTVNAEIENKVKQLTELTNDMDNLLASTEVGTVFLDRDLRVRKFTPVAADTFSLLPRDVGRSIESFNHDLQYDHLIDDVRWVLENEKRREREVQNGGGSWYLLRLLPYYADEDVGGVVITLIDVDALKDAQERVRQAVIRRDEFLAMLSHELRNPLAAVVNAVELARSEGYGESRAIQVIDRQSRQMARLLGDLLDISRVTRDKIRLKSELLELREILAPAVDPLRPAMEDKDIELEVRDSGEPLMVMGDAARLQQVLGNLISNAVKYNSRGGRVWVHMRRDRNSDEIVVRVCDDGIGLDGDMVESVFEPFVQAKRALSRSEGGIGVGLSLVHALVTRHGGKVCARSEGKGFGSEFEVRLPSARQRPRSADDADGRGDGDGVGDGVRRGAGSPSHRILVIEDDVDNSELMRSLLEQRGHDVRVAGDGHQALDEVCQFEPQVALVDIGLPGLDGFQVARAIRDQHPETMLIAVTGYGRESDRSSARSAGFDLHLVKPVTVDGIEAAIGRASEIRNGDSHASEDPDRDA